jgi:keratan sulfate 6-sulfotransferase 1
MKLVLQLLKLFPNLKIIHLVRDPRGIMNSRINQTQVKLLSVMKLCEDLKNDLAYSKIILSQYPDNIYIVRYEDLATNTIETAKTIFKFVNLRFTNAIKQSLLLKIQASRDTCRFCVIRRNSSETSSKWRMNLDLDTANYVYKACKFSNQVLGYLPFTDINTLRNLNLPSRKLVVIKSNMLSNKQLHI